MYSIPPHSKFQSVVYIECLQASVQGWKDPKVLEFFRNGKGIIQLMNPDLLKRSQVILRIGGNRGLDLETTVGRPTS